MQVPELKDVIQNFALWKEYSEKVSAVVQDAQQTIRDKRIHLLYITATQKLFEKHAIIAEFKPDLHRKVKDGEYEYTDEQEEIHIRLYERFYCCHYESETMHLYTLKVKGVEHEGSLDLY
uniref:Uncharacterized protein n=1 Tax=Clandestinovirus TaxID=2831644 RepID=A0A8F8PNG7_9VIRU|nr:hypothetical protein KOM_12_534 [Clandestinovirus]